MGENIHEVGGDESGAPESSPGYRWRFGVITVKRVHRELREMTYQIRDSFASGRKSNSNWLKRKGKLLAQVTVELGGVFGFGHGFRIQGISSGLIFLPPLVSGCPLLMASRSCMFQSRVCPSSLSSSPVMSHELMGSEGVGM